ncbi:unnamed protein product [Linum tenue]|nr:unnamed protein product [Linum tenue]
MLMFLMGSGSKGCNVIFSREQRTQSTKSMKFMDGYMISSGQPMYKNFDFAARHILLRQGVLGIKVKIKLGWDPKGKVFNNEESESLKSVKSMYFTKQLLMLGLLLLKDSEEVRKKLLLHIQEAAPAQLELLLQKWRRCLCEIEVAVTHRSYRKLKLLPWGELKCVAGFSSGEDMLEGSKLLYCYCWAV